MEMEMLVTGDADGSAAESVHFKMLSVRTCVRKRKDSHGSMLDSVFCCYDQDFFFLMKNICE